MKLPDIKVPEGWTFDLYPHWVSIVIARDTSIGGGFVTINFDKRIFASGMTFDCSRPESTKTYSGRGWTESIVHDAVEWLEHTMRAF